MFSGCDLGVFRMFLGVFESFYEIFWVFYSLLWVFLGALEMSTPKLLSNSERGKCPGNGWIGVIPLLQGWSMPFPHSTLYWGFPISIILPVLWLCFSIIGDFDGGLSWLFASFITGQVGNNACSLSLRSGSISSQSWTWPWPGPDMRLVNFVFLWG